MPKIQQVIIRISVILLSKPIFLKVRGKANIKPPKPPAWAKGADSAAQKKNPQSLKRGNFFETKWNRRN